jgi:GMP synthase (glutamine-hydrolysing)
MVARLLVIQHEDDCPPGWLGGWAEASGLTLDIRTPYRANGSASDELPAGVDRIDGLLVLGGEMGAYDDARCPWLAPTRELIRSAVSSGVPTLGICLGLQLVTVAMGGSVLGNPKGRALGVTAVTLTDAGREDQIFSALPDDAVAVQWNNDVVDRLPDDAQVLARDPRGDIQAARFGSDVWGLQFHPEVNAGIFQDWVDADSDGKGSPADGGPPPADVVAEIRAVEGRLEATWRPFAERFAAVVLDANVRGRAAATVR